VNVQAGAWGADVHSEGTESFLRARCVRVADFDYAHGVVRKTGGTMRAYQPAELCPRLLRGEDILVEGSGGGDLIPVGRPVLFDLPDDQATFSNFIVRLRAHRSVILPAFLVLVLRVLHDSGAVRQIIKQTTGIQNLDLNAYLVSPVAVPSMSEQAAIVKYLAHATTRIDKTIAAKRRLIALLEEQRDAIADEYVTGRIEPSLRDTGLTWLPTVPEGWDVCPLKRHWRIVDCKHLTVPFIEDGIPLASIRQAQRFFLDLSEAKRTDRANYENLIEGGRRPSRGDLIYCRNVSVGAAAVVSTDEVFALGQDVCLLHSRDQSAVFLNHFLRSSAMRAQLEMLLVGSTFRRINVEDVRGLLTVVPPTHRQEELSAQIAERTAPMLRAVERAAREIVLLQEFRTRLIADVVTGQVDVRGIASTLPDIDPTTAWAVPDPDDPDPGASDPDNDDVPDA